MARPGHRIAHSIMNWLTQRRSSATQQRPSLTLLKIESGNWPEGTRQTRDGADQTRGSKGRHKR